VVGAGVTPRRQVEAEEREECRDRAVEALERIATYVEAGSVAAGRAADATEHLAALYETAVSCSLAGV
jgi:hypothetical protein